MTRRPLGASGRIARGVPRLEADPAAGGLLAAGRRLRRARHAARGGAPDQGPDDRRLPPDAGRDRRGGRAAPDLAGREGAVRDRERRVRLLHHAAVGRDGHRAVQGRHRPRPGGRAGPRQARRAGAAAAGRRDAAGGGAARHRRRAGGGLHPVVARRLADAAPPGGGRAVDRAQAPPPGRPGVGARRAAARGAGDVRPRPPGGPPGVAAAGVPGAVGPQLAAAGRVVRDRRPGDGGRGGLALPLGRRRWVAR